tara:strand:+ start:1415 stop:1681 length:267 start_codon:yes stop_codon:yes gene_type:complete
MIDDKKLIANSEKLLGKIYELNNHILPVELFDEVAACVVSINRLKRAKVLYERRQNRFGSDLQEGIVRRITNAHDVIQQKNGRDQKST